MRNSRPSPIRDGQLRFASGATPTSAREFDKAIADFTEVIRQDPNGAVGYNNRGVAYGYKGEFDKAIADCNEALRRKPHCAEAYLAGALPTRARANTRKPWQTATKPSG